MVGSGKEEMRGRKEEWKEGRKKGRKEEKKESKKIIVNQNKKKKLID